MTTVELDISSEGLMDQIMALVAPPRSTSQSHGDEDSPDDSVHFRHAGAAGSTSSRRNQYRSVSSAAAASNGSGGEDLSSWRKPRANCHDYCDSCGTFEGDRLVCDRCPASFHLECLDPPMEPDEASTGVWFCHRCTMIIKEEDDNASTTSSTSASVTAGPPNLSASQQSLAFRSRGRPKKPGVSSHSLRRLDHRSRFLDDFEHISSPCKHLQALDYLIQNARILNPKEFDLPKDLVPDIKLPGSYKSELERKTKSIIELENSMVPHPIKTCDVCDRTCQHAALLQCSYCPSCFHLDCLDPPLSSFPPRVERWMCPHHAEHLLDDILFAQSSDRLSERMRLQSLLPSGSQLNQHSIVTRFLRQVQRRKASGLPWRNTTLRAIDEHTRSIRKSKIPVAIKNMYRFPAYRLVRPGDFIELNEDEIALCEIKENKKKLPPSDDERDLFLHTLLGFHIDSTITSPKKCVSSGTSVADRESSNSEVVTCVDQLSAFIEPSNSETEISSKRRSSLEIDNALDSPKSKKPVSPTSKRRVNGCLTTRVSTRTIKKKSVLLPGEEEPLVKVKDLSSNGSSETPYKCHGNDNHIDEGKLKKSEPAPCDIAMSLKEQIEKIIKTKTDVASCLEDKQLVRLLARDHLTSLRSNDTKFQDDENSETHQAAQVLTQVALDHRKHRQRSRKRTRSVSVEVEPWERLMARALLLPLSSDGARDRHVRMPYRQLTIGTDPGSQLCLQDYGVCCKISGHHATIFYDEWTRSFEMINYSEHGTLVDGVPYSNEICSKMAWIPKVSRLVCGVRGILSNSEKFSKRLREKKAPRTQSALSNVHLPYLSSSKSGDYAPMVPLVHRDDVICSCVASQDRFMGDMGWEGTAVLHDQSLIQFGCIRFLFCSLDPNNEIPDT